MNIITFSNLYEVIDMWKFANFDHGLMWWYRKVSITGEYILMLLYTTIEKIIIYIRFEKIYKRNKII